MPWIAVLGCRGAETILLDSTLFKGFSSQMKTTSVTALKNQLSARLKEVAAGETIVITDRRKPIGCLQPLAPGTADDRLAGLCARGIVSVPPRPLEDSEFFRKPKATCDPGLTAAVIEERERR